MPPPRITSTRGRKPDSSSMNIPPLNLPKERDDIDYPQKKATNVWDIKLNTPDTSSTVSWGVSANRSIPRDPRFSERGKMVTPKNAVPELENIGEMQNPLVREPASSRLVFVESFNVPRHEFLGKYDDLYWKNKAVLFEAILVDQLSRSVLCDPAQDVSRASSRPSSSRMRLGATKGDKPPINLHQTLVNPTDKTVNEAVLSKRVQFDARVVCRDGSLALKELSGIYFYYDNSIVVYELRQFGKQRYTSLPFIERSNYVNLAKFISTGPEMEKAVYGIHDITPGFDLVFMTEEQNCLPPSIKQARHCVVLRITAIDESAKFAILQSSTAILSKQMTVQEKREYLKLIEIQKQNQNQLANEAKLLNVFGAIIDCCNRGTGYYSLDFYANIISDYGFLTSSEDLNTVWSSIKDKTFNDEAPFEHFMEAFFGSLPEDDSFLDYGFLTISEDLNTVWSSIKDKTFNDEAPFEHFMEAFFGSLPEDDSFLVKKVMLKLDPTRTGFANPDNFLKFYKSGRSESLYRSLQKLSLPDVKEYFSNRSGRILDEMTWGSFNDFYFVLSICIRDPSLFNQLISETWGVQFE